MDYDALAEDLWHRFPDSLIEDIRGAVTLAIETLANALPAYDVPFETPDPTDEVAWQTVADALLRRYMDSLAAG